MQYYRNMRTNMNNRRHDPAGYTEIESAKLQAAIDEWLDSRITDAAFVACLHTRGFVGSRLREEFLYQQTMRQSASGGR